MSMIYLKFQISVSYIDNYIHNIYSTTEVSCYVMDNELSSNKSWITFDYKYIGILMCTSNGKFGRNCFAMQVSNSMSYH